MPRPSVPSILEFTRRTTELTADETRAIDGGWVFSTRSIPIAWGLNHVRFSEPVSFERATAVADDALADLSFRQIVLEHDAIDEDLLARFASAGWKIERDLLMELIREPARAVDTTSVVQTSDEAQLELSRRWTLEDAPAMSTRDVELLLEFSRRESRVRGDRGLGIVSEQGILAKAKLRSDGTTAQVEDVYTAPEARGRGYGRAVVTRAVELARAEHHELIFIIADDNSWPKRLYAEIGFEPVGQMVQLHREVG